VLAATLLGYAFLTKMLQGVIVVPAFALAYLVAAPTSVRKRVLHLFAAGGALIVAAGWWVALVELWPAGSRPYIGGSTNNSVLQLIFGYNGFGRLTGSDNNGTPGGNGGGGFSSGSTGWLRMFDSDMGTQISWLLPAALIAVVALAWQTRRRPRTDALRASVIVWGGWLLVTGVVFSFASGIIHPYYSVALAPAIAAMVGLGVVELWRARAAEFARWTLAGLLAATAVWTDVLLGRADWHPELRWIVLLGGAGAVAAVLAGSRLKAVVAAPLIAITLLVAPAAYSLQTAATAHTGSLPTAGPASAGGFGAGPGGFGGAPGGGGFGGPPNGQAGQLPTGRTGAGQLPTGRLPTGGAGGGMAGGLGGAASVSSALKTALEANASDYSWVAATTSSNEAGSLELTTGKAVMAIGGFNGTDNAISLAAFKQLVAAGRIHYYVADGQGFIGSTQANTTSAYTIQHWVESTFTATTIGNTTVYDLTAS
jgi:4-amino-4-deoxy-L-arabinose transferase-like glycosyltransferase